MTRKLTKELLAELPELISALSEGPYKQLVEFLKHDLDTAERELEDLADDRNCWMDLANKRQDDLDELRAKLDLAMKHIDAPSTTGLAVYAENAELRAKLAEAEKERDAALAKGMEWMGGYQAMKDKLAEAEAACAAYREALAEFLHDFLHKKTCVPGRYQRLLETEKPGSDLLREIEALREVMRSFADEVSKWWYHPNFAGSFDKTLQAIAAVGALKEKP